MKRTLSLKREALAPLATAELVSVAGAALGTLARTCPALTCVPQSAELYITCTCCTGSASC